MDIKGRAYDIIRLQNGKTFHGEFFMYIFEDAKRKNLGIDKFQVIQKSDSEILIKVVCGSNYGMETEKFISKKIQDGMGNINILFEYVDDIQREKSGKMRLICAMKN